MSRGRIVVLLTCLTVVFSFALSCVSGAPVALPGVALGSPVLLHLERALVVGAFGAGALIFLSTSEDE